MFPDLWSRKPPNIYYIIFLYQNFKLVCSQINLFLMASGFCIIFRKAFSSLIYLCVSLCVFMHCTCIYLHIYHSYSHLSSPFILFFGLAYIYCKEYSSQIMPSCII